jgi:hypothetical protein
VAVVLESRAYRLTVLVSVLLTCAGTTRAAGPDQGLDALLFGHTLDDRQTANADVSVRTILYRVPLSLRLRSIDDGRWGLRLTFPVLLSGGRIKHVSDVVQFVKSLGIAAVIPVGRSARLPFGREHASTALRHASRN